MKAYFWYSELSVVQSGKKTFLPPKQPFDYPGSSSGSGSGTGPERAEQVCWGGWKRRRSLLSWWVQMWDTSELFCRQSQDSKKIFCVTLAVCVGDKPGDVFAEVIKEVTVNRNNCWGFEFSGSFLWLECFPKRWRRSHEPTANCPLYQSFVSNINPIWGFAIYRIKSCK